MILDNKLDLNLYVVPTIYYMVIISENQELAKKKFLNDFSQKSVIRRVCGQTLGLGLGQSKDIVVVIISLQRTKG